MKISLETLPALFVEIGEQATDPIIKKLAARCALFVGVMQKMAAHIEALEAQFAARPVPENAPAKPEAKDTAPGDEIETEPLNKEAAIDLDAEVERMAARMNQEARKGANS